MMGRLRVRPEFDVWIRNGTADPLCYGPAENPPHIRDGSVMAWVCPGHAMGMRWVCYGCAMTVLRACDGHAVGPQCEYGNVGAAMFWVHTPLA